MDQRRARRGVLEESAEDYQGFLVARGLSSESVRHRMSQWGALGRWLGAEDLGPWGLTDRVAERHVAARRSAGRVTWVSTRSLALPLTYLRDVGVAGQQTHPREDAWADGVAQAYRRYLREERGLAAETQRGYLRIAGRFCQSVPDGWSGLGQLGARDVSSYVVATSGAGSVAAAKKTVTALASLLRYLFISGVTAEPLWERLPKVSGPVPSPRGVDLDSEAVSRVVAACDPRQHSGVRDRAVILVMARLGLRAGEVAALSLDDVDWLRGEMVIHGKGARLEPVPLPADVGQAVAGYLRGRPPAPYGCRSVFLRLAPPAGPMTPGSVSQVVRRAARRAGLPPIGSHRLRHYAATNTLRAGAPLGEVAELLRQRSLQVTARYAHLDPGALRELARPWPGVSRLDAAVADYLALRHNLGFTLKGARPLLVDFAEFLDRNGAESVTTDLAVAWATAPAGVHPIWWRQRLGTVRGFARYLATIEPGTQIPAEDLLPARYSRRTPYLYSEAEITALMAAARELSPPLRAATYTTLIGLLAVTGLRLGEAIGLDCSDLRTDTSSMIVHGKNGRSREIPLHPTSLDALHAYRREVERAIPRPPSPSLLVSIRGTRLCPSAVHPTFRAILSQAGLPSRGTRCPPRLHDARHSVAMRTLIDWYEAGADVDAKLPLLSAFLGHANPASTYWYLQAAPELFSRVAERLDHLLGAPS